MLLYTCFHHNTNYYALLLNNQIRTGLIAVLHHRILKLSSSKLKYQYIGKIINLLSTDMNILQLKLTYIFQGLGYPILLIGSIVLLIQRLGISGLVCVLGPLSIFLIQYFIGNTYQNLYTNLNLSKDERIQRITETL
jgi:ABC-type multidrug transport system fused ATPase/permease subunit